MTTHPSIAPISAEVIHPSLTVLTYALPNLLKLHLRLTNEFTLTFNHISLPDGRTLYTDHLPDNEETQWMFEEGKDHSFALRWFNWVNENGAFVHSFAVEPGSLMEDL